MPPAAGNKRKRGDRTWSQDSRNDAGRPSPHRPDNLNLAQQHGYPSPNNAGHNPDGRGRGGRRVSRTSRGGGNPRNSIGGANPPQTPDRGNLTTSKAMSPPTSHRAHPESSTNAVTPRPPATRIERRAPSPKPLPKSYSYEFIIDERVTTWRDGGRKAVVEQGIQAQADEDPIALGTIFQELLRSAVDGRIAPVETGAVIKDILGEDTTRDQDATEVISFEFNSRSMFLDNLSIFTDQVYAQPTLQALLSATGISPDLVRLELDAPLMQSLGLVRDTFTRMAIRKQTNLIYRQSNYNLLREETEGYSKLMTDLYVISSMTSPRDTSSSEVVQETFERVKAMIGAFDLDVGRALDVILDVTAALLVKQFRFFVKFFRLSSWWPKQKIGVLSAKDQYTSLPSWALPESSGWTTSAQEKVEILARKEIKDNVFWDRVREIGVQAFFEIGRQVATKKYANLDDADSLEDEGDRKWVEETGTLPPPGNRIAAQLLGFKLRFYASDARDQSDVLPMNLIYLAGLLVKIGFISLRDLYPHLCPADEAMEGVREKMTKEKVEREKANRPGGGAMNALMMAGALADDTLPPARIRELETHRNTPTRTDTESEKQATPSKDDDKDKLPEPADQKVQLLRQLLALGALPDALYILGKFPWLLDLFPDLPEYLHRILHHSLSKVYESLRPLADKSQLREQKNIVLLDQTGVPKGYIHHELAPIRKSLRWCNLDLFDAKEGIDYRFYWDDWNDSIPVCQTIDDVFTLCSSLLNYSGVKIGQDPLLLLKLTRIGKHSLGNDQSSENKSRWIDLCKRLLVPALSLTKNNPGVVNEVFDLLKNFSTETRYSIYAEWYSGQISRLPDIKLAFDQARAETKDVMKRISKTNTKPMARALARVAYSSPGVVFNVAISQIESYDNLVEVVVECARYFTYLGYDVLTWSLMSALGQSRSRVQADGMLTSKWLAALSLFAGRVFRRYSVMNPTPILQYVAEQLRKDNSTDLIVLEQITSSMAGIVSDSTFNDAQIQAMSGGRLLQSQTMLQLLDKRHESKPSARRLMRALTEPKLAGQLLVSIAQHRQTCIFKVPEPDAHLKLLGNLFDQIHRVLIQYLDLLRSNLTVKEFDQLVPDVVQLISDFGLEPNVAFWLSRPSITQEMSEMDKVSIEQTEVPEPKSPMKSEGPDAGQIEERDIKPEDASSSDSGEELSTSNAGTDSKTSVNGDIQMKDVEEELDSAATTDTPKSKPEPWHPVLKRLMDKLHAALPEETWTNLSDSFYVTFWQLSLYDIQVPSKSYEDEIERQKKRALEIARDKTDVSAAGHRRRQAEREQCNGLQKDLLAENKHHLQDNIQTKTRLGKEKEHWFSGFWGKFDALNVAIMEHCFFPRMLLSPMDALYTFKMLKYLHSSGTPNFRTMGLIDLLFREKRLTSLMFLCTSKEAENFGRFLNEVLKDLDRWHKDKKIYEREAFGTKKDLPGFARRINQDGTIESFLDYEEFRRLLYKWHRYLNAALKSCLRGGEYMHIRNAIIVLKAVHQYFPAVNFMGKETFQSITDLSKSESREDLKIAAMSLMGNLKKRESLWVLPHAFNIIDQPANGQRSSSTRPGTPKTSSSACKPLNAGATEFKPGVQANANENSNQSKSQLEGGEDGEIKDIKMDDVHVTTENNDVNGTAKETVKPDTDAFKKEQNKFEHRSKRSGVSEERSTSNPPNPTEKAEGPVRSQPESIKSDSIKREPQNSSQSNIPPRPDITRNSSSGMRSQQHTLPSRPETRPLRPFDNRSLPPPPIDHRRDGRDTRDIRSSNEYGRLERPNIPHERPLLHPGPPPYLDSRSDRPPYGDRDRFEPTRGKDWLPDDHHNRPSHRELRPPSREADLPDRPPPRYRPPHEANPSMRSSELPLPRDSMPPPRQGMAPHPDRMANIQAQPHPARAALIERSEHEHRPDFGRREPDDRRTKSSRPSSPSRGDSRTVPRYDDRRNERAPFDDRRSAREQLFGPSSRPDETSLPSGPRNDRTTGPMPRDYDREPPRASPSNLPPRDINHGRLNQDFNFGGRSQDVPQTNSNPNTVEIPHGPRGRNTPRNGRNAPMPMNPPVNTQRNQPPAQAPAPSPSGPERQPPTGPSSTRGGPRDISSTSSTLSQSPDTAGIHPDRLKALQQASPSNPRYPNSSQGHPHHSSAPNNPSPLSTAAPPSGPRGLNVPPSPLPSSPSSRNPPPGPSFPNERGPRGDKRFAGIQNVLQQNNDVGRGTNIRGRASRQNSLNIHTPTNSVPPTPSTRPEAAFANRADLFADHPGTPPPQPRDDTPSSRGGRRDGDRDRDRGDREGGEHRSSRRGGGESSRSHSQDHSTPGRWEEEPRSSSRREPRGDERSERRRGTDSGRNSERDDREPRRSGRTDDSRRKERREEYERGGRGTVGVSTLGSGEEERQWNGERREERERRDGGSGRKRGRGGDDSGLQIEGKRPRRGN
ncbi:MAG: THO complex subunit 2 [Cirrosporium novae-zelandiae]|nr:MAG: THO complex subunit 2 [Cirrosporium novae-zelandiae]